MRILSRVVCFWVLVVLWGLVVIGIYTNNADIKTMENEKIRLIEYKLDKVIATQAQVKLDLEIALKSTVNETKEEIVKKLAELQK